MPTTSFECIAAPNAPAETWSYGGAADAQAALLEATKARAGAWLNLLSAPTETEFPRAALEAEKLAVAQEPVVPPHGLTLALAARVVKAAEDSLRQAAARAADVAAAGGAATTPLGSGLVVQCATGNRASAALALLAAHRMRWTPEQVFAWAAEAKLPFLGTQPLRNWVAAAARAGVEPARAPATAPHSASIIFRQLFHRDSSTYTYLLGDAASGEALLIDPVIETAERDATTARELGLRITTVLNTHVHADHVSGASRLRGLLPGLRSAVGAASGALADACLADGDVVPFGRRSLRVVATPGHTLGCISFVLDDESAVFTGDALLVRGCGRTDFQGGSSQTLYKSIRSRLFTLPRTCAVYPGHDYNGFTSSTIGEEADFNPRAGAGRSADDFDAIMASLKLAKPALIDIAVPANMRDGILAGAPPAEGIVPPADCLVCRQDGGPLAVKCEW